MSIFRRSRAVQPASTKPEPTTLASLLEGYGDRDDENAAEHKAGYDARDAEVAAEAAREAAAMLGEADGTEDRVWHDSADFDGSTYAPTDPTTTDGDGEPAPRARFVPGYEPTEGLRILRARLVEQGDGTATVTFRGQISDVTRNCWIEPGTSGTPSLYAEVWTDDTTATEVKVALVPTGKRPPQVTGGGHRLGTVKARQGVRTVYLLGVDGTVDRAAYEAERARVKAERRAAAEAAARWAAGDADD